MAHSKKDKMFIFFFWELPWKEYAKSEIADIFATFTTWLPKGRNMKVGYTPYPSKCPFYEGYWLDGGSGGIECRLKENLISGREYIERCYEGGIWKGHTYCSYYREEMGLDEAGTKGES